MLSIIVVALRFGGSLSVPWLLVVGICVVGYGRTSIPAVQLVLGIMSVAAMTRTGIHATVLGVVLGLATSRNVDAIRDRWQPLSAYVAVPLFIFSALTVQISELNGPLVSAITAARIIGKPAGVLVGAAIAIALLRPSDRLPWKSYAVAGSVAGLGFSVSMLFAELSLDGALLAETKLAVLIALAAASLTGAAALRTMRRPQVRG